MDFEEIKPHTPGWNQIKSELERNVKAFEMIADNTEDETQTHASKLIGLMKESLAEMKFIE